MNDSDMEYQKTLESLRDSIKTKITEAREDERKKLIGKIQISMSIKNDDIITKEGRSYIPLSKLKEITQNLLSEIVQGNYMLLV
jgi:hypothetical protein